MEKPMLEYVLERLDASRGRLPEVAEGAGISYRTLQKISQRIIRDPGVSNVQKLYDYFRSDVAA